MGIWKFFCVECKRDVVEEAPGHGCEGEKAICRECSRKMVAEWIDNDGGARKFMERLCCYWCSVHGNDRTPAKYSYRTWGLCEKCYQELGKPKVGTPKPERPNIGREFLGPILPVVVEGEKEKAGEAMALRKEIDWSEVQRKRDGGATLAELSKEFGVSGAHISVKTKNNSSVAPKPKDLPAAGLRKTRVSKGNAEPRGTGVHRGPAPGNLSPEKCAEKYEEILLDLRTQRDQLNVTIETIERMYHLKLGYNGFAVYLKKGETR